MQVPNRARNENCYYNVHVIVNNQNQRNTIIVVYTQPKSATQKEYQVKLKQMTAFRHNSQKIYRHYNALKQLAYDNILISFSRPRSEPHQ